MKKKQLIYFLIGGSLLMIIIICIKQYIVAQTKKPAIADTAVSHIEKSEPGSIGLTSNQIMSLENMYERDGDENIAKSLLQHYLSTAEYSSGFALLGIMKEKGHIDDIQKITIAYIIFNYAIQTGQPWKEIMNKDRGIDGESIAFYDTLSYLLQGDTQGFDDALAKQESINVSYKNMIISLRKLKQTFSMLKDPPPYYYKGLIAATLMEEGYMPLASLLAQDILSTDKKYILSYEILSQAALKQKKYEEAITYLTILFNIDPQHIARTAFYLGDAYFWKQDYQNALIYLNQVRDSQYLYDAIRYMILSYYHLSKYDSMMEGFRYLLTEHKVTINDYLLLFDISFYDPYVQGRTGDIAQKYALEVIIPYIDSCRKDILLKNPYVCKYGEAGWYLSQNKPEKALKDLLYLTKTYPHPIIFKALGDYYTHNNDLQKAQVYYMKSLISSADTYETQYLSSIFSGNKLPK